MPILRRENAEIFYEFTANANSDNWVTLINGYTRTSSDFRAMSQELAKAGFSVLIFDNRGAGKTKTADAFSLEDIVEDVILLGSKIGIIKTNVLGISMGGVIAMLLACKYPNFVSKLVLVSTTIDPGDIQTGEQPWGESVEEIVDRMNEYFSEGFVERNKLLIEAMSKNILKSIEQGSFKERASSQRAAYRDPALKTLLNPSKIACPVLVLHGKCDRVIPVEAGFSIHRNINGSQIKIIDGIGHLLLAECPKRLYQEAIDYFNE